MQSKKILDDLKNGGSYCIERDINSLGEVDYERYIFYIPKKDKYMFQFLDWNLFIERGFNKNSVKFEYVDEVDAKILIESFLEKS